MKKLLLLICICLTACEPLKQCSEAIIQNCKLQGGKPVLDVYGEYVGCAISKD